MIPAAEKFSARDLAKKLDIAGWSYRWGISIRQLSQLWTLPDRQIRGIVNGDLNHMPSLAAMQHMADQVLELNQCCERELAREPSKTIAARYRVGERVMTRHLRRMREGIRA